VSTKPREQTLRVKLAMSISHRGGREFSKKPWITAAEGCLSTFAVGRDAEALGLEMNRLDSEKRGRRRRKGAGKWGFRK